MQRVWLPGKDLSDVPELTNVALEYARWNTDVGCLIDRVYPDRPLIVTFGYVDWFLPPTFNFFGRTKKLEQRLGITLNRLLLRDPLNAWYHRGVPGMGTHVDEVAATLRSLIRSIRPSSVITIGQSMGGYAAIMFGMLLNADRILSFGPLSHLDPREATRYGDLRFLPPMDRLDHDPPKACYLDLPSLGKALDYRGTLHLIFGTHPGNDDGLSGSLDAMHAMRLAGLPGVRLHPYPEAEHTIVDWLVRHGRMDDLLDRLLLEDESCEDSEATSTAVASS